jgi:two-component system sensor histidine kinase UhpB
MIARELHDELGQSVTAMRSMALSIASRVATTDAAAAQAAQVIADESSRLYDAMHGIIPRLTPLVLDNFGLADALGDLVERTRRSQPELLITCQIDLAATQLPAEVALALYRAAQEGITNSLRHGQARHLRLTVRGSMTEVSLALVDDGCGLPAEGWQRPGHYGLRWLVERIESLNGELRIAAAQPRGVQLQVCIALSGGPP